MYQITVAGLDVDEVKASCLREGREAESPERALLGRTEDECREIGERIAREVAGATLESDVGFSGGGALPGESIPTTVVAVRGST